MPYETTPQTNKLGGSHKNKKSGQAMIEMLATTGAFFLLMGGLACSIFLPFLKAAAETEGFHIVRSQLYGNTVLECQPAKHWRQLSLLELKHNCQQSGRVHSTFNLPLLGSFKLNELSIPLPQRQEQ